MALLSSAMATEVPGLPAGAAAETPEEAATSLPDCVDLSSSWIIRL